MLGLTGGIGAGKSTVARMLAAEWGAAVIDTDGIARIVVEPHGAAYAGVLERFGDAVLASDGHIDRARLADIVFEDAAARADLNAIIHPAVEAVVQDRLADEEAAGTDLLVLEVPLLVEAGWSHLVSKVVVVDCPDDVAIDRLVTSRGMSTADARRRLAAQARRDERLARADIVLHNDGSLDNLSRQVAALDLAPLGRPTGRRRRGAARP